MSILKTIDQISFKKIVGISIVFAAGVVIPITVWVTTQQETRLASKAYFEKPEVQVPTQEYGDPSAGNPQIGLVWPFLGKIGDAVLIEGNSFGDNPQNKRLIVGGVKAKEEDIRSWTPELIEFVIPEGAKSGRISLEVAGRRADWPYYFTIYSVDTKIQVTENNDIVKVLGAPNGARVEIFYSDGTMLESGELDGNIPVASDKTIISVVVKDSRDNPLPFWVKPSEFGF